MEMQMEFIRRLPTPQDLKEQFPLDGRIREIKEGREQEIEDIHAVYDPDNPWTRRIKAIYRAAR